MQIIRIGLDLAKYVFEVHGVNDHGKAVLRKTLRRDAVSGFFANLPPCQIGMEASNGAHYWAKVIAEFGHEVRLISPQFVTPYVKSNKNDRNDAEAICEAVGRPHMRFVPVKSVDQLAVQAVHRIRSRLVAGRTRLVNQIRGVLWTWSHCAPAASCVRTSCEGCGRQQLGRDLAGRSWFGEFDRRIATTIGRSKLTAQEQCQRLGKNEGIGPERDGTDGSRGRCGGFEQPPAPPAGLCRQRSMAAVLVCWHQQTW